MFFCFNSRWSASVRVRVRYGMSLGFFVTADHDGHTQVIAVSLLKDEDQVHCCVCLCACACVSERLRVSSCVCPRAATFVREILCSVSLTLECVCPHSLRLTGSSNTFVTLSTAVHQPKPNGVISSLSTASPTGVVRLAPHLPSFLLAPIIDSVSSTCL